MSLIVALAISALGLTVRAIYENSHYNTGNQASDIVGIAATQVGYGEDYSGYTKYGDWYGLPYSDWCAMFVSWCANQAGVGTDVFPSFALCSAGADWFISQGRFHYAGDYAPQAGDLIFYASYGNIYHVGLVTGSDDYNVYSIEGNYNEAVYNVSYPLSYGDILGYATPAYATSGTTVTTTPEPVVEDTEEEDSEDEIVYDEDSELVDEETSNDEDENTDDALTESVVEFDTESVDVSETSDNNDEDEDKNDTEDKKDDTEDKKDETDDGKTDAAFLAGDANGDGVVDSADALLIQRYLAGSLDGDLAIFNYINADADGNGEIDIEDALYVLEMSVAA